MNRVYRQIYLDPAIAKRIKMEAVRQDTTSKSIMEEACLLYIQLLRSGELKEMVKERDREKMMIELEEIKEAIDGIRSDRKDKINKRKERYSCSKS